jgi:hypothetical protein
MGTRRGLTTDAGCAEWGNQGGCYEVIWARKFVNMSWPDEVKIDSG